MKIKTTEQTRTETITTYVAADGTEFNNREACEKYEQSYLCAIMSKIKAITIKETGEYSLFEAGSDDHTCYVVIPKTPQDITNILQMHSAINNTSTPTDYITDGDVNKVLILTVGYEGDWMSIKRLDDIIDHITCGLFTIAENPKEEKAND